jgi:hypothetical protein
MERGAISKQVIASSLVQGLELILLSHGTAVVGLARRRVGCLVTVYSDERITTG